MTDEKQNPSGQQSSQQQTGQSQDRKPIGGKKRSDDSFEKQNSGFGKLSTWRVPIPIKLTLQKAITKPPNRSHGADAAGATTPSKLPNNAGRPGFWPGGWEAKLVRAV